MASSVASSDKEIEQQLVEAGNRLTDPPSSVDELLPLLDQVEHCLSKVEQSPPKSMQNALCPSLKALVSDQFFKHSNVDVKVAVASCISEITRITAPDAPYDDEQMKEVFQLIVSSFENLDNKSSRSYDKRTSILETVAKVRSCVVMLDLECDALIIEMFQHFLKAIRDYHSENVFSSMETIMNLVLEESEDISLELLSPILASVKKDNEEVTPIAQKLAERVLESCATKLKPYVIQAVKSLGISLDDYGIVVASICQETSGTVEQNDVTTNEHVADESNSVRASAEEAAEVDKEIATEAAPPEQADPTIDRSPKSAVSNGVTQTGEEDSLADSHFIKKQEHDHLTDQSKNIDTSSNAEPGGLETEKVVIKESKQEQTTKKKGKKSSSLKLTEPSDTALIDGEKEAETLLDNKDSSKDVPSSPCDDPSVEAAMSSENEKETGIQLSSPKAIEGEPMNVASPSPSVSLPDENRSKKSGRLKKKESLMKEAAPSAADVSKKASEGSSDSEAKPGRRSGKKVASRISNEDETPAFASKKPSEGTSDSEAKPTRRLGKRVACGITNEDETPAVADAPKKESGIASDSEAKPLKRSAKKVDASSNNAEESSKQTDGKKRRSRGKTISKMDSSKTSTKDEDKEMVSSPKSAKKSSKDERHLEETPKTNSKRKRTPVQDQASDKEHGEDIVGSKVKVWWPRDHMYYKGVIGSFDPVKKKHMVFYNDGDEENLNLRRERWEFIESDSESDEEEAADRTSLNDSSELPQKKKAKTISDQSTKQGKKMDALPKRGGGSSSKTKAATTKSGRKSKDDNKVESKSKDGSKAVGKSEIDSLGKSKDHAAKSSGKPVDVASKPASKSKNDEGGTPKSGKSKDDGSGSLKTFTKSKQDTLKTSKSKQETTKISSAKGKSSKSGSKSTVNGSGKMKSGSSKARESEDVKEDSSDLAKSQENTKGKSPSSSKAQGSEAKSGKKRRR